MTKTLKRGTVTLLTVSSVALSSMRNAGNSVASATGSVHFAGSMGAAQLASGI